MYVDISSPNVEKFIEECIVTSKLDHPNVLSLIGVSMNPEDATLHMIMSFMHHGDVKSFLKSKRGDMIEFDHFPTVHSCVSMYSNAYNINSIVILCVCDRFWETPPYLYYITT